MTDANYEKAAELRRKAEAPPPEYDPDEPLRIIGGPFKDMVLKFRRVANPSDPLNRKVVCDGPFGEIAIDPLDVKKAV